MVYIDVTLLRYCVHLKYVHITCKSVAHVYISLMAANSPVLNTSFMCLVELLLDDRLKNDVLVFLLVFTFSFRPFRG